MGGVCASASICGDDEIRFYRSGFPDSVSIMFGGGAGQGVTIDFYDVGKLRELAELAALAAEVLQAKCDADSDDDEHPAGLGHDGPVELVRAS